MAMMWCKEYSTCVLHHLYITILLYRLDDHNVMLQLHWMADVFKQQQNEQNPFSLIHIYIHTIISIVTTRLIFSYTERTPYYNYIFPQTICVSKVLPCYK